MHLCTVATLCFLEKTFPRNYYYCDQDDNSLSLCFKSMYLTLFVAIFTSNFIFSMSKSFHTYRNIYISNQIKDLPTEKPKHFWATIGQNLPKSFIRVMRNSCACTCRRVRGLIFSPFYHNQNFMGFCQKIHKDPSYLLKMALYWPKGSGTLRQQLLMMHGIAWHCMVLHCIAWYCMVLYGIA